MGCNCNRSNLSNANITNNSSQRFCRGGLNSQILCSTGNGCNSFESSSSCNLCRNGSVSTFSNECQLLFEPVGIPFWVSGYYNKGCNCCNSSDVCSD